MIVVADHVFSLSVGAASVNCHVGTFACTSAIGTSAPSVWLRVNGIVNRLYFASFGQNHAMQNAWNPYVSQLNSLAGLGENAAATTGNIGATTGTSVAHSQLAAGQAQASGIAGVTNAATGGIQSGLLASLLANSQQNNNATNLAETSPGYVGSTPVSNYG